MKKTFLLILLVLALGIFASCGNDVGDPNGVNSGFEVTHKATIEIKDYGTIELDLYGKIAPVTVLNFEKLANEGFYDGLTFHRIIEDFMMQGGCPNGDGTGGSDKDIYGEFKNNGSNNTISHVRGTISMARSGSNGSIPDYYYYDTASSQFFIVHEDSTFLDGNYAAFGTVTSGMKVVDKICTKASTVSGLVEAKNQPVIESIRVTCIDSEFQKKPEVTHTARIEIENYGVIELELYGNMAPITVANFEKLANEGFYNGLTFHRIIKGFMAQGGCPKGNGSGDSGTDIKGEFLQNRVINTLTHERGVISMARSNEPDSGSCQFFIVHQTSSYLDGAYAAFGRVTSGIEIVDRLCEDAKPTDGNGSIAKDAQPVIKSITVEAK